MIVEYVGSYWENHSPGQTMLIETESELVQPIDFVWHEKPRYRVKAEGRSVKA